MKKITIFKLGNDLCPANQIDIDSFCDLLEESKSCLLKYFNFLESFATNYNLEIEEIEICEDSFLIVSCATDSTQSRKHNINWITKLMTKVFESDDRSIALVTHHAIDFIVKNIDRMSEFSSIGAQENNKFVILSN